jgi:hypothetical protein
MKTIVFTVAAFMALSFGRPNARAQQPCRVRLAVVQYQPKNFRDASSPEHLTFGSLPPVNDFQESTDRRQICLDHRSGHFDYALVWERTQKGYKGEVLQPIGDNFKTVASAEEESASELVDTLLHTVLVHAAGLAPAVVAAAGDRSSRAPGASPGTPSTCRIHLAIVASSPQPPNVMMGGLVPPQRKWLEQEAGKKFPQICPDYETPQFLLAWTQNTQVVPSFRVIWHPGGTATYHGTTTGTWGYQTETTGTITLPGYTETVPSQQLKLTVYAYLYRVADGKLVWSAWREQGTFGSASRRVLEDAFKFLAKPPTTGGRW